MLVKMQGSVAFQTLMSFKHDGAPQLGGWYIKPSDDWMRDVTANLTRSIALGVTPIERHNGGYGWAIRRKFIPKLSWWLNLYGSIRMSTGSHVFIEMPIWDFWRMHAGHLATPLLIDHSSGFSFTHNTSDPHRSRWQGKREWWEVWLKKMVKKKTGYEYWVVMGAYRGEK
jgi:hypothetical protein